MAGDEQASKLFMHLQPELHQKPQRRSIPCDGAQIVHFRHLAGMTQRALARRAGYSERLVRKAEAGGRLSPAALRDLAAALSTEQEVRVECLMASPKELAARVVEIIEHGDESRRGELDALLDEDVTVRLHTDTLCGCPPSSEATDIDALFAWAHDYFAAVETPAKMSNWEFYGEDDIVVAWHHSERILEPGTAHHCAAILRFNIAEGSVKLIEILCAAESTSSS